MREQQSDRQTEIHTDRQTDRQTDGAKILYRYPYDICVPDHARTKSCSYPIVRVPDRTSTSYVYPFGWRTVWYKTIMVETYYGTEVVFGYVELYFLNHIEKLY